MKNLIVCIFLIASGANKCQVEQSKTIWQLTDVKVEDCKDQDKLYRTQVLSLEHSIEEKELKLHLDYLTECCQNLSVSIDSSNTSLDTLSINLKGQGEMCDCYCTYPIYLKLSPVYPIQNKELQIFVNKKPVKIISTGYE